METWEAAYIAGIIDGEGSKTLTRMHANEYRRPCITIASNDIELLKYVQNLTGGSIYQKKDVFRVLEEINVFLRIERKRKRAEWILNHYNHVTPRNGKYSDEALKKKLLFEERFFKF